MKNEAKKPINILFASFEAEPFMKTGGLGDVAGTLPAYIAGAGFDIRVILPKLSVIPEKYREKMQPVACFEVQLSWRRQYCGLLTMRHRGATTFTENLTTANASLSSPRPCWRVFCICRISCRTLSTAMTGTRR